MDLYTILKDKIHTKKARICIVGLGYVGLPLAVAFVRKGFTVYGLDTNLSRVHKLRKGEQFIVDVNPQEVVKYINTRKFIPTTYEVILGDADIIIVCVPTPVRKVKIPDISFVVSASRLIKSHLKPGHLVILESTSYPTTTREVVLPVLKESGLKEEKEFFLCFSPERVNPGDKKYPLQNIPKIVGGLSAKSGKLAQLLYSQIIEKIFVASSPEVAETAKLYENTFRLVNIALANEFAMVCDKLHISMWEVIEAAKTKPFGFMPFYPGPGIGGHCIPCDPLYLSWKAKKLGFKTKMIDLASFINHFMPQYVVARVKELLKKRTKTKKPNILLLGVTYKKDVKDLRESPALEIIKEFIEQKWHVHFHDPYIPYLKLLDINIKGSSLTKALLKKCDCAIIVTDHTKIDYAMVRDNADLIFDTRNVYKKAYANVVTF